VLDFGHQLASQALATTGLVDHERHQPAPTSVMLQQRHRMQGGDTQDQAIRLRGDQHTALVSQPIVQPSTHPHHVGRIPQLPKQDRDTRGIRNTNRPDRDRHVVESAKPRVTY
jgi:hypothetical protein